MPRIWIDEEYGFRTWVADLTADELADLQRRWRTIRGLTCLVPVRLIVPQAREVDLEDPADLALWQASEQEFTAHFHEYDDSWLAGVTYVIPKTDDESFSFDGRTYSKAEVIALFEADRAARRAAEGPGQ